MPKKYPVSVSEESLRKLVKTMVEEELEKHFRGPSGHFIDDFPDEPWGYFGEPQPAQENNNSQAMRQQEEFQGMPPDWGGPFFPAYEESDNPPLNNKRKKK